MEFRKKAYSGDITEMVVQEFAQNGYFALHVKVTKFFQISHRGLEPQTSF